MPFLTDCNTLYPGSRKNALEHLDCANINGFNPITTGCQILIGDGLRGTDEIEVPVVNGEYCKTARIGRAIMDADIFISLTHFKGHEATGFGGMNCLTVSGNCLNFSNCPAVCFWKNTEQLQTIKSAGGRYPWILSRFLFLEYVV